MERLESRWFIIASFCSLLISGCGTEPLSGPSKIVVNRDASPDALEADVPIKVSATANAALPLSDDAFWNGLEPHEIQLDQKLLVVKGSRGVVGCPYLNIASFEKFGEACAIVPAVDVRGLPDSKVTAVTTKARELGIEVGMSGREALDRIR